MGLNIGVCKTKNVTLVKDSWTKLANASYRRYLLINNISGNDVKLVFRENPWKVSFAAASSQYIDLDNAGTGLLADASLLAATSGSIKAKILFTSTGTGVRTIFTWSNADGTTKIDLAINAAHKLYATAIVGGVTKWTVTVDTALSNNTWYDIKLQHDGTIPKLFVSSKDEGYRQSFYEVPQTLTGTVKTVWFSGISTPTVASLGQTIDTSAGANFFDGSIQRFAIFSGLATKYNRVTELDLHFTEGTGATVADQSGNGYTANFAAAGAAPTWASFEAGMTLKSAVNEWWDCTVTNTAIWCFTAGATPGTIDIQEGR